jgi:hypothetical protein
MKSQGRPLAQKLVLYGLGAGAASLASHSEAGIVYSGPVEFTADVIHFDLENAVGPSTTSMPGDDFVLQSKSKNRGGTHKYSAKIYNDAGSNAANPSVAFTPGAPDNYALRLSAGNTIGSGQTFITGDVYLNDNGSGQWPSGSRGFLGLRLTLNANNYYGWADVTLNNVDESAPGEFTLHSYAFDTVAGQAITAGQVPEPGTIALLVTGAAGIAALRRRKK